MIKTFEQTGPAFAKENHAITATTTAHICGGAEWQTAELEAYLNAFDPDDPHIKEIEACLDAVIPNIPAPAIRAPVENIFTRLRQARQEKKEKRRGVLKRAAGILLYAAIVCVLLITVILNGRSDQKLTLFGYSGFTVLSESMQSEIPEGALVLVKRVDPDHIRVGDDITFIRRKDNLTVTHRVIRIDDHYGESGGKGFQTQGIENAAPDQDVICADDIIGVVKHTVPGLGSALHYISVHAGFLLAVTGIFFILTAAAKHFLPPKKTKG